MRVARIAPDAKLAADQPLPLWPPLLATRAAGGRSRKHAHHAIHLVLALVGELTVELDDGERRAAGIVTPPDMPHAIDARGREVMLVFLDPESAAGAALLSAIAGRARLVTAAERGRIVATHMTPLELMSGEGRPFTDELIRALGGKAVSTRTAVRRIHPRVRRALDQLRAEAPEYDRTLEQVAGGVGLSAGRFMHAFTDSIGIPFRPYLAWLKLQRAAAAISSGMPLVQAAHAAGFADAAHMTRSFRNMFGVTPSELKPARVERSATPAQSRRSARNAEK